MPATYGIDLPALLGAPPGSTTILPSDVLRFVSRLSVLLQASSVAERRIIHSGIIQSPLDLPECGDAAPLQAGEPFPICVPALTNGLPFRLFVARKPVGTGEQFESPTGDWTLQIDVPEVKILLPFRGAQYEPETATTPAALKPYPNPSVRRPVWCTVDAGVLEINSKGQFQVRASFTFDLDTEAGFQLRFHVQPPQFYFFEEFGARIGEVILDFSKTTSPPVARAAGFGDDWTGAYLQEVTLFFPRNTPFIVPKLASLRNALIGDSFAGEAVLEFAAEAENPPSPTIYQVVGSRLEALSINGNSVSFTQVPETHARIVAVADINPPWGDRRSHARWVGPDGQTYTGARTPPIAVAPGDTLEYSYAVPEGEAQTFPLPPTRTLRFTGTIARGAGARFKLIKPQQGDKSTGSEFDDVTFVSAKPEWFDDVELRVHYLGAAARAERHSWIVNHQPPQFVESIEAAPQALGRLSMQLGQRVGIDADGLQRFVVVDVEKDAEPPVVVSGGKMYHGDTGMEIPPTQIKSIMKVYHQATALRYGRLREFSPPAPVPGLPPLPDAPQFQPGKLYEVYLDGTVSRPRTIERVDKFSLFFEIDVSDQALPNIELRRPGPGSFRIHPGQLESLRAYLNGLQKAKLYIVGRTSTIGTDARNRELGPSRARQASAAIGQLDLPSGVTIAGIRGEFETPSNTTGWPEEALGTNDNRGSEPEFQRADVYIATTNLDHDWPAPPPENTPIQRRVLVPGPDQDLAPEVYRLKTDGRLKRLKLLAAWNRDPWPTKSEILMVWDLGDVPVSLDSPQQKTDIRPASSGTGTPANELDLLRIILRWVYDSRSGRSRWTGLVDSAGDADGLVKASDTRALGVLLLLGPVLANRPPESATDSAALDWVLAGALLTAAIAVTGGDNPIIKDVNVTLYGVGFDLESTGGLDEDFNVSTLRLWLDYGVEFTIDERNLGINNTGRPTRIRYRRVGLEISRKESEGWTDKWWEHVKFLFDPGSGANLEVEDAGRYSIKGPLGNLLQIVSSRIGHGSTFLELDLAFAADLGIVEISRATVRIVLGQGGPSVELRGLRATLDVPNTLKGTGSLTVGDRGSISAALDIEVIPASLRVAGALAIIPQADFTAVAVALDVELPTGIPLASSGLGVYGFLGRFAANMKRKLGSGTDRVEQELNWIGQVLASPDQAIQQWGAHKAYWSFGVGIVIGTLPDRGRSFHAKGALVLEIPGPTVVFGINAAFVKETPKTKGGDGLSGVIRGLILIDPCTVIIAIEVNLSLPEKKPIIEIAVPISALFAISGQGCAPQASYVRIGSDGVNPGNGEPSRAGRPITVAIKLGDIGGVRAFSYLMIEEKGLQQLGRNDRTQFPQIPADLLNFNGFSIGFGLGIEIRLGQDPIYLAASVLLLVGLGTSPFAIAGVFGVNATVKLLILTLGVTALIAFRHDERITVFTGQFCATIGFLFFSITACIDITIGSGDPYEVPAPPLLISGMGLVDRRIQETASIHLDEKGDPIPVKPGQAYVPPVVWPDTVPVLHFIHEPVNGLDANAQFTFRGPRNLERGTGGPIGTVQIGNFVYTYTLKSVQLEKKLPNGEWESVPGPLDAAWWWPTFRPAFLEATGQPPSGLEARELGLLTWHPAPWSKLLGDGQAGPKNKLQQSLEIVCQPFTSAGRDTADFCASQVGPTEAERLAESRQKLFKATVGLDADPTLQLRRDGYVVHPFTKTEWPAPLYDGVSCGLRLPHAQAFDKLHFGLTPAIVVRLEGHLAHADLYLAVVAAQYRQWAVAPPSPDQHTRNCKSTQPDGWPLVMAVSPKGTATPAEYHLVATVEISGIGYDILKYSWGGDEREGLAAWHILPYCERVWLLSTSGVPVDRLRLDRDTNAERERVKIQLFGPDSPSNPADTPTRPLSRFILDAGATYRVTVKYGWSGAYKAPPNGAGSPSTPKEVTQAFEFTTAWAVPDSEMAQSRLTALQQSQFDPRALSDYIDKLPSLKDYPVFTEAVKKISVIFRVSHLEALLERYGRRLTLEVVRTDLPAPEPTKPHTTPAQVEWRRVTVDPIVEWLNQILAGSPCQLSPLEPDGAQADIDPVLAPNGRYDLLIHAKRADATAEPESHTLLARAPFRASRYHNPEEMFAAFGFGAEATPTAEYPLEFMLTGQRPSWPALPDEKLADDIELAQALRALNLDTLEAGDQPKAYLIWRRGQDRWAIDGVLLDGVEPIVRSDIKELAIAFGDGGPTASVVRASTSGARALLWLASSYTPPVESRELGLTLSFRYEPNASTHRLKRIVPSVPTAIMWEEA